MECRDSLAELANKVRNKGGMYIQDLKRGDLLKIKTENNVYFFQVTDPEKRIFRLVGQVKETWNLTGVKKKFLIARGSSLNNKGDFIRVGWICPGYRFCVGDYLLSETQFVEVDNQKIYFLTLNKIN